jgi:hypothetical protein
LTAAISRKRIKVFFPWFIIYMIVINGKLSVAWIPSLSPSCKSNIDSLRTQNQVWIRWCYTFPCHDDNIKDQLCGQKRVCTGTYLSWHFSFIEAFGTRFCFCYNEVPARFFLHFLSKFYYTVAASLIFELESGTSRSTEYFHHIIISRFTLNNDIILFIHMTKKNEWISNKNS